MARQGPIFTFGVVLIVILKGAGISAEPCPRQVLPFLAAWRRMAEVQSPWYGAKVSEIPAIIALKKAHSAVALNFSVEELEKAGLAFSTCRAWGREFVKIENLNLRELNPEEFSVFFPFGWLDGEPFERLANVSGRAFLMASLPFAPATKEVLKLFGWSSEMFFAVVFLQEGFYLYQLSNFARALPVYEANFYAQCRKSKRWLGALKKELAIWHELSDSLEHMARARLITRLRRIVSLRRRHLDNPQVKACWQATEDWEVWAGLAQYYEFKILLRAGLIPKALERELVESDLKLAGRYKEFYYSSGYMYARALARLAPQTAWQPAVEKGVGLYELLAAFVSSGSDFSYRL